MERNRFDSAVTRYSRRIYTFASYLLGNTNEAEDVAQEVLIKLWKRGGKIDPVLLGSMMSRMGDLDFDQFMPADSSGD